jgi:glycosyltransferase involved in cell wall biosynthesis
MRIWNIKVSEPVPWLPEEADQRFFRAGLFEKALREAGHQTLWFSNTFAHNDKSHRNVLANSVVKPHPEGPDMVFLKSPGYRVNMGMARFYDHWVQARAWRRLAVKLPRPDLILCAYPTLDLCAAVVEYGQKNGIPVVIDVRDLWPDVIYERLGKMHLLEKLAGRRWLWPYEHMSTYALRHATALTGVGRGMVEWAQERSGRTRQACARDRHFYQSQPDPIKTASRGEDLREFWQTQGIDVDAPVVRIVWGGTLFPSIDAKTLFDGLALLPERLRERTEILICGTGPLRAVFEAASTHLPQIKLVDWVPPTHLMGLLMYSDAGLLNYFDRFDFRRAIPNKVVDYAAAGLPIITGIQGELRNLAGDRRAIVPYTVGDPASMAAALEDIHTIAASAKRSIGPSRRLFDEHFESSKLMQEFVEFIENLAIEYAEYK